MSSLLITVAKSALLTLTLSMAAATQASAATTMSGPDCSKMTATMSTMSMPAMASTGNVDKDAAAMMADARKMMMMAAKVEAMCGKDPSEKKAAQKFMLDPPRTLFYGGTTH